MSLLVINLGIWDAMAVFRRQPTPTTRTLASSMVVTTETSRCATHTSLHPALTTPRRQNTLIALAVFLHRSVPDSAQTMVLLGLGVNTMALAATVCANKAVERSVLIP